MSSSVVCFGFFFVFVYVYVHLQFASGWSLTSTGIFSNNPYVLGIGVDPRKADVIMKAPYWRNVSSIVTATRPKQAEFHTFFDMESYSSKMCMEAGMEIDSTFFSADASISISKTTQKLGSEFIIWATVQDFGKSITLDEDDSLLSGACQSLLNKISSNISFSNISLGLQKCVDIKDSGCNPLYWPQEYKTALRFANKCGLFYTRTCHTGSKMTYTSVCSSRTLISISEASASASIEVASMTGSFKASFVEDHRRYTSVCDRKVVVEGGGDQESAALLAALGPSLSGSPQSDQAYRDWITSGPKTTNCAAYGYDKYSNLAGIDSEKSAVLDSLQDVYTGAPIINEIRAQITKEKNLVGSLNILCLDNTLESCAAYESDIARPGMDYANLLTCSSWSDCSRACSLDSRCDSAQFTPLPNKYPGCWLKTTVPDSTPYVGATTVIPLFALLERYANESGVAGVRNSPIFHEFLCPNKQDCINACEASNKCDVWTWGIDRNRANMSYCWLQSGIGSLFQYPDRITGQRVLAKGIYQYTVKDVKRAAELLPPLLRLRRFFKDYMEALARV